MADARSHKLESGKPKLFRAKGRKRGLAFKDYMTLEQVKTAFPSRGKGGCVSVSTLWRWMQEGKRGVKLRYSMSAGRRMISIEAIQDFIKATNEAAGATEEPTGLCLAARARIARHRLAERYGMPTWKHNANTKKTSTRRTSNND